ncbi:hypothetical protein N836_34390 [Leptolyngbya sp. Heron Island J]|uniref:hypothetical protein n=1 Tax=Leptolyngbya sp. Heron Island J TaxID=1385935 RepID=UPI0003B942BC|nr:hypothetical protein [Leptolyngbya sp. Heron Island J]ESA37996.1 hypothetical protein N836_34390 [Leptolyngbya sp. Heron Island J]
MVVRVLADKFNASKLTRRVVSKRFPEETIELCTAATILEASEVNPIGWSFRRLLLQRNGNVVFTNRRVFLQSSFRSPATIIWASIIGLEVHRWLSGDSWTLIVMLTASLFLFRRRPYAKNLLFSELEDVRFGSVYGLTGRGDIIVLNLGTRALHLVISRVLSEEVKRSLEDKIGVPKTDTPNRTMSLDVHDRRGFNDWDGF